MGPGFALDLPGSVESPGSLVFCLCPLAFRTYWAPVVQGPGACLTQLLAGDVGGLDPVVSCSHWGLTVSLDSWGN